MWLLLNVIILVVTLEARGQDQGHGGQCVPLAQCEPAMHIVDQIQQGNLPAGVSREVAIAGLRKIKCDFDGASNQDMNVRCPDDPQDLYTVANQVIGTRTGIINTIGDESDESCALELHTIHPDEGLKIHSFQGRRNDVATAKGYGEWGSTLIVRLRVTGPCCWKTYPNRFRRGAPSKVIAGFDGIPEAMPRSLQRSEC